MKFNLFFSVLLIGLLLFVVSFQTGVSLGTANVQWTRTFGGEKNETAYSIIQADDGGYAIAGSTNSFGSGGSDFLLIKTDSSGVVQWNRTFGGANDDVASALLLSRDGGYVIAGLTNSYGAGGFDFWLVKADSFGNIQWNKTYGGVKDDFSTGVIQTIDDGYAVTGWTNSFGAGGREDVWLVKTDESGKEVWNTTYGGSYNDEAHALTQINNGDFVIAGDTAPQPNQEDAWLVRTDSNGNMLWNSSYGGSKLDTFLSIVETGSHFVLSGYSASFGKGLNEVWLVQTNLDGNMQWNKTYGGPNDEQAYAMVQANDGGFAMAGQTIIGETKNYLLIKTDAYGNVDWTTTNQDRNDNFANSIIEAKDGMFVLAGVASTQDGGQDVLLVKINENGSSEFPWLPIVISIVVTLSIALVIIILLKKNRHY